MLCIMDAAISSSQRHITFMPPSIFSIVIVHRGIIIMFGIIMPGIIFGIIDPPFMPMPVPIVLIIPRSMLIIVSIGVLLVSQLGTARWYGAGRGLV